MIVKVHASRGVRVMVMWLTFPDRPDWDCSCWCEIMQDKVAK